tara:strand:+ start:159 stop:1118 length:960 start_codon:yes stop_codon:yes gene_type:complete
MIRNVLSLFDGMSCGQQALKDLGIEVDNYYASEIDKYAIEITQKNFPNTIQLGNVKNLCGDDLPQIDLLMGGSPCQGFSFAGKQLNFDDPRSALFFEFVRLYNECNPKYFLLENVRMKKEYQDVITEHLGVEPIMINSSLVSAQNRVRLYWTNIPNIEQPQERGIVLKDILEDLPIENSLSPYMTKDFDGVNRLEKGIFSFTEKDKSAALTGGAGHPNKYLIHKSKLPKVALVQRPRGASKGVVRELHDKSPSMTTSSWEHNNHLVRGLQYRKLTPLECERLQTLPDKYTEGVSNTQRYKMIGNGWTVEVIKHILNEMI